LPDHNDEGMLAKLGSEFLFPVSCWVKKCRLDRVGWTYILSETLLSAWNQYHLKLSCTDWLVEHRWWTQSTTTSSGRTSLRLSRLGSRWSATAKRRASRSRTSCSISSSHQVSSVEVSSQLSVVICGYRFQG
jgi:hypothetical protein